MAAETTDVEKLRFTAPVVLSILIGVGSACISVGSFVKAKEDVDEHEAEISVLQQTALANVKAIEYMRETRERDEREAQRRDGEYARRLERIENKIDKMADRDRP